MADLLISLMEMPKKDSIIVAIRPDGMIEDVMGCYIGKAVELPPNGDLIDRDEVLKIIKPYSNSDERAAVTLRTAKRLIKTALYKVDALIYSNKENKQ